MTLHEPSKPPDLQRRLPCRLHRLAPNLVHNHGWRFVSKVQSSARANKPGLLASEAGASLVLKLLPVEFNIAGQPNSAPTTSSVASVASVASVDGTPSADVRPPPLAKVASKIKVSLRYLVSYARQGIAQISCTSGCTCDSKRVNAHDGS